MSLHALQQSFCAWLHQEDAESDAVLGLVDPRGLSIYQNNYRFSLMACLDDVFEHTLAWLGEETFYRAVVAYIKAYPPNHWTLDAYPARFPTFLAKRYPHYPEVAELAALEWRLSESFVAADAEILTLEDLPTIDWEEAHLRLPPSASLIYFVTNAPAIWAALAEQSAPPKAVFVEPAQQPKLIWRENFICSFRALDEIELEILPDLIGGLAFSTLCDRLALSQGVEQGVATAGRLLARWTSEGLLVRPEPSQATRTRALPPSRKVQEL